MFSIDNGELNAECKGLIDEILRKPSFRVEYPNDIKKIDWDIDKTDIQDPYEYAIYKILDLIQQDFELVASGHRVVHGGTKYSAPIAVNDEDLAYLDTLSPLAALHQPYNLKGIRILRGKFPNLPQIACFDTAFHTTCNELSQRFAIPKWLTEEGIKRYGFHGLSYEYITSQFDQYLPSNIIDGKVVIAHLGSGVSMCAVDQRKSVAISIGFSVLDGLPMSTRCGNIDAGVLLHLMKNYNMTVNTLSHLLYKESGLLGLSDGISSDMRSSRFLCPSSQCMDRYPCGRTSRIGRTHLYSRDRRTLSRNSQKSL